MANILIISASIRLERHSHRVAQFFEQYINSNGLGVAEIADLQYYQFPLFEERLSFQQHPSASAIEFAERVKKADGIIIITPEYNGGYPASLKNIIDLLYAEWHRKPIAIATVSDGVFGGSQVITSLQFVLWKMKAWVVPAMFPVRNVIDTFDEQGLPKEESTNKRAAGFIAELQWCMKAAEMMKV
jgi:NAD(P)H-dependent FMN reductase